jgi:nucleoside-diphosphate-sugar epimerase
VPGPRERPVQFIDGRDLARWIVDIAARDVGGAFNACSGAWQFRMGELVNALVAASSASPRPAWIDDEELVANGVTPWVGLPLWLPPSEPDSGGFMTMDCSRAQRAGLSIRPLAATIRDTARWLLERDNAGAWKQVLTAEAERAILAM